MISGLPSKYLTGHSGTARWNHRDDVIPFRFYDFSRTLFIPSSVEEKPIGDAVSSFLTSWKKSHFQQLCCFCASVPCTAPPQKVPATAQHARPAFMPPWMPFSALSIVAGQMPSSPTSFPPGWRSQFLNSQQFVLD